MDLPENNKRAQTRGIPHQRRAKKSSRNMDTCLQIPEHPIYKEECFTGEEEKVEEEVQPDDLDEQEHVQVADLGSADTSSIRLCGTRKAPKGAVDSDKADKGEQGSPIELIADTIVLCYDDNFEEQTLKKDEAVERLPSPLGGCSAKAFNNEHVSEESRSLESNTIVFSLPESVHLNEDNHEVCDTVSIELMDNPTASPYDSSGTYEYQHLEHDVFAGNATQDKQNHADMIIQMVVNASDKDAGKSNVVDKNGGALGDRAPDPAALDNLVNVCQITSPSKNRNKNKAFWTVNKQFDLDCSPLSGPFDGTQVSDLQWNLETEREAYTSTDSDQTNQHGTPFCPSAYSEPAQPDYSSNSSSAACQGIFTRKGLKMKLCHESQSVHRKVNAIGEHAFLGAAVGCNLQDKRNMGRLLPPISLGKPPGLNIESSYCLHDVSQQHRRLQEEFWKQPAQCHPPTLPPNLPSPTSQPMPLCLPVPTDGCSGDSHGDITILPTLPGSVDQVWTGSPVPEPPMKKIRTFYSQSQLEKLEKMFMEDRYPNCERRLLISSAIEVSPQRVVVWFQNRRAKLRKMQRQKAQAVDARRSHHTTDVTSRSTGSPRPGTATATATTTTATGTAATATAIATAATGKNVRRSQECRGSLPQCPTTSILYEPPRPPTQPPPSALGDVGRTPGSRGPRLLVPGGAARAVSPARVGGGSRPPTPSLSRSAAGLPLPQPPLPGAYCGVLCTPGLELGTQLKNASTQPPPLPHHSDGGNGGGADTTMLGELCDLTESWPCRNESAALARVALPLMSPPPVKRSGDLPLHMVTPTKQITPLDQNGPELTPVISCNIGSAHRNPVWQGKEDVETSRGGCARRHTVLATPRGSAITNSLAYPGAQVPSASTEPGALPLPYTKGQGLPMHYCYGASFPPSLGMPPFSATSQVYFHSHNKPLETLMPSSTSGNRTHCRAGSAQDLRNQQHLRQSSLQQQQHYSTMQQGSVYKTRPTSELLFQRNMNSDGAGHSGVLHAQTHLKSYGIPSDRDLLTALQQMHSGYGAAIHSQMDDSGGAEVARSRVSNAFYFGVDGGQAAAREAGAHPLEHVAYGLYGDNSSHVGQPLPFSANHVALPVLPATGGHAANSGHSFYTGHRAKVVHSPLLNRAGQLSCLTNFNHSSLDNHALTHRPSDCLNHSVTCRCPHGYSYKPVPNQPLLYNSVHANNAAQPNHSAHLSHPVHYNHSAFPRHSFAYNHSAFLHHSTVPNNVTQCSQLNCSVAQGPLPVPVRSVHPTAAFRHGQRPVPSPSAVYGTYFSSAAPEQQRPGAVQHEAVQFSTGCDAAAKSPGLAASASGAGGSAEPAQCALGGGDGDGGGASAWQGLAAGSAAAASISQFYYQPDCSAGGGCLPPQQTTAYHVTGGGTLSDYAGHAGNLTGGQYASACGAAPAGPSKRYFAQDGGADGHPVWACSTLDLSPVRPSRGGHNDDGELECTEMLAERITFTVLDGMDFQDDGADLPGQCRRSLGSCSNDPGSQDSMVREEDRLDQAASMNEENREV